jgi:hypothetical protein
MKFIIIFITVLIVGCNGPETESSSSASTRTCNYQEKPINCEEFDRLMGNNPNQTVRKTLAVTVTAAMEITNNVLAMLENTSDTKNENFEGEIIDCEVMTSTDQKFVLELNNRQLTMTNRATNLVLKLKQVGTARDDLFGDWTYDELDQAGRIAGRIFITISPKKIKISAQCLFY